MRRSAFLSGSASLAMIQPLPHRLRLDAAPLGDGIDPYRQAERGVDELAWLYADGLVGWDRTLVPALAESLPERSVDGMRYRYDLRRATWHDGQPLCAQDVALALDLVGASPWGGYEPYRSIRRLVIRGARSFEVFLRAPRQGFVRSFFAPYGVPALPLIRHSNDGTPLGSGPFAIAAHPDPGRWTLRRATTSRRGVPRLDEISLRLVLNEITANVQMLSGEADIVLPLPPGPMTGHYRTLSRLSSVEVLLLNSEGSFDSVAARRALLSSVNVPRLQRIFHRSTVALDTRLTLTGFGDAAYARALIYRPEQATALRRMMNGREVRLLYVAQSRPQIRVMLEISQQLQLIGISTRLLPVPGERYFDLDRPLRRGTFDIAAYGLAYGDDAGLAADWSSDAVPPHGGNFSRWRDQRTDAALARGDSGEALRRLYDGAACIVLGRVGERIGISPRLTGFAEPALLVPATYSCTSWSI